MARFSWAPLAAPEPSWTLLEPSCLPLDALGSENAIAITRKSLSSPCPLGQRLSVTEGGPSNLTTLSSKDGRELGSHQCRLQLPTRAQQSFSLTLALVKLNRLSSTPQGFFGDLSGALASPLHPWILPGPPGVPREHAKPRACSLNPRASTLEPRPSSFSVRALTLDSPLLLCSPGCS